MNKLSIISNDKHTVLRDEEKVAGHPNQEMARHGRLR